MSPQGLWILSSWQDLLLFIGTPLLIAPLFFGASKHWDLEEFSLIVLAFGSLGHHAPGLMRAYGDRELFHQYRLRFILAPLLGMAVFIVFAVQNLSGTTLVLVIWGVWHFLMQTYGFARIYDAKAGCFDKRTRRLDFWMCLTWFATGVLFADDHAATILNLAYKSGVPILPTSILTYARQASLTASVTVTVLFLINFVWIWQRGGQPNFVKILLLGITFGYLWFALVSLRNVILGLAMLEVFHDIQYLSIVWVFNRKRAENDPDVGSFTRFLFRRSGALIGVYLGLVTVYGLMGLAVGQIPSERLRQFLVAVIGTSTLLHYYYDGFIWKIRDSGTRRSLGVETQSATKSQRLRPAVHGLKWAGLAAIGVMLWNAERSGTPSELKISEAVVATIPKSPQAHYGLAQSLVTPDERSEQIGVYAYRRDPAHETAARRERFEEAVIHCQEALRINPNFKKVHFNWGNALLGLGRFEEAVQHYQEAVRLKPDLAEAHFNWGNALRSLGRIEEAVKHYQQAVRIKPDFAEAHYNWAGAVQGMGRLEEAVQHYQAAVRLNPNDAETHYNCANTMQLLGRFDEAVGHYQEALRIKPTFANAHNNLGKAYENLARFDKAAAEYKSALQFEPNNISALNNLAWLLATCSDDAVRDGPQAVKLAEQAASLTGHNNASILVTLSSAYAEAGNLELAVAWQEKAVRLVPDNQAEGLRKRLELYRSGKTDRQPD